MREFLAIGVALVLGSCGAGDDTPEDKTGPKTHAPIADLEQVTGCHHWRAREISRWLPAASRDFSCQTNTRAEESTSTDYLSIYDDAKAWASDLEELKSNPSGAAAVADGNWIFETWVSADAQAVDNYATSDRLATVE